MVIIIFLLSYTDGHNLRMYKTCKMCSIYTCLINNCCDRSSSLHKGVEDHIFGWIRKFLLSYVNHSLSVIRKKTVSLTSGWIPPIKLVRKSKLLSREKG